MDIIQTQTLTAILESQLAIEKVRLKAFIECENLIANHFASATKKTITEIERQLDVIVIATLDQVQKELSAQ